jgi:hypothetical protein
MALVLGSSTVVLGQTAEVPLEFYSGLGVTNVSFLLHVPPGRFNSFALQNLAPQIDPATVSLTSASQGTFEIRFASRPGQSLPEYCTAGQLTFLAEAGQSAGTATFGLSDVAFTTANGFIAGNVPSMDGQVTVISPQATVEKLVAGGDATTLRVLGRAGAAYRIECSTDAAQWAPVCRVAATQDTMTVSIPAAPANATFRAVEFTADPPVVEAHVSSSNTRKLLVFGLPDTQYTIEYTTNSGPARVWYPLASPALTDSFIYHDVPNLGSYSLFRVRKH